MSLAAPAIPITLIGQTQNQSNLFSWGPCAGATSYTLNRSTDGVNFSTLITVGSPTVSVTSYVDTAVTNGITYYYQVQANNSFGSSAFSASVGPLIPAPTSEMSLYGLRQASQQKADRVNSQFVTTQEWNFFINLALTELYDLLITVYEDYFMAPRAAFIAPGNTSIFALPNGTSTWLSYPYTGSTFVAQPFYKLLGVDLGLQNANNAFVTVNKYQLIDRNRFVYPNTASTIYGVFNLQYRLLGTNIEFIPTPSGGQLLQLLYIPRLPQLLQDTDITTIGFSGWLQYAIVRAAKYALDKEESDTTKLDAELLFLKARIEETSVNRDAGQPDLISNTRQGKGWGWGSDGFGQNGSIGGW